MSVVTVQKATGVLLVDGARTFPIGFSNGPPPGSKVPGGGDAFAELAAAGATFIRTGNASWSAAQATAQVAAERQRLDAAAAHGLHCWTWLGQLPDLPATASSSAEQVLVEVVDGLKTHPALLAYKGVDEPANPVRGKNVIPPARLVRAYTRVKALDPDHPVVIIQAPRGSAASLVPYRPALDVTGADIYPIAYPPGKHAARANTDISLVGDITKTMVAAAGSKPVWMTLQIAWSGVTPTKRFPDLVPRFPTLLEERFMVYQAIANGARGLTFFGGHLTEIAPPADAQAGWNWTFWQRVLRPIIAELRSTAVGPALVAADAAAKVKAGAADIELITRQDASFVYVIALRRSPSLTSLVSFTGLPKRHDGRPIGGGEVLFEYAQNPPPPPIVAGHQEFRTIGASNGGFRDWFGPHDAHVYRFPL